MSEQVVLINPFTVPEGKLEESIQYWEVYSDFMQQQPGYVSTSLHQSVKDDATFQLINIAVWESQEFFYTAAQKMRKELGNVGVEGLSGSPALYQVIRQ